MSFTYDVATNIGKIRLEIGDTTNGSGVKPDGTNLSDEELQVILTRETTVMGAAAAACELLARHWARVANIAVGSRREDLSTIADQWAKQARALREQYGNAAGAVTSFSTGLKRVDGYSAAADEGDL